MITLATTNAHNQCQRCGHHWITTEPASDLPPAPSSWDASDVLDIDAAMMRHGRCARCGHQGIQRAGRSPSGVWVECERCRYGWVMATRGHKRI